MYRPILLVFTMLFVTTLGLLTQVGSAQAQDYDGLSCRTIPNGNAANTSISFPSFGKGVTPSGVLQVDKNCYSSVGGNNPTSLNTASSVNGEEIMPVNANNNDGTGCSTPNGGNYSCGYGVYFGADLTIEDNGGLDQSVINGRTQLWNTVIGSANQSFTIVFKVIATGDKFTFNLSNTGTTLNAFTISAVASTSQNTAETTQTVIADFMSNRAGHILNNQPGMIGYITGSNNGGGGPLGNLQLDSDFDTQTTMSFYTSRSKILGVGYSESIAQEPTPASLSSAERFDLIDNDTAVGNDQLQATDEEQTAAQGYQGNDRTGTWDVWTELHGAQSTQPTITSKFWAANVGAHYFVNNDMLIGLLTEFDWASETNTTANSKVSGNGYMIGPYIAGKVKDQALFYEARALWGQSLNDVSPIGTYTDEFETERWLASLKVQGSYDFGDQMILEPSVSISYFEEVQKSYTDNLSNTIPEQTISLGEFKFGPTLTRSFDVGSGFTMQTSVGISGIVNFSVGNANTSTNNAFANEDARARVDAGFELKNEYGIRFVAAGYYDGIGVSDYQSYGGKLGLVVPFN